MNKQVVQRIQISQMCQLVIYDDGSAALWSGADRVALSAYEATRLGYALLNSAHVQFPVTTGVEHATN